MGRLTAMILAGGKGNRMEALCQVRPKPVLPFGGHFRVIDFTLSNCIHSGIDDLAALTDYQRSHMAEYLGQWRLANPVRTLHALEPRTGSYKGTADAVYQNLDYLNRMHADNVIILAGDHIYRMDYRKMLAFHENSGADVTVGVVRVPSEEVYRFGTVFVDDSGRILNFIEKSPNSPSNLASMGIYIFNKDILSRRLEEDASRQGSPHDFGYAIMPDMVQRDRVYAYEFKGYWQDIGTPQAYYAASMELLCGKPALTLNSASPVLTHSSNLPPPRISDKATVINSIISPGCVILGHVENSVLSPGVCVEEKSLGRNSVLMTNAIIGLSQRSRPLHPG